MKKNNNEVKAIYHFMLGDTRNVLKQIFKLLKKQDGGTNLETVSEKIKAQAKSFVSDENIQELTRKFPTFTKENIIRGITCYSSFVCWKVDRIIADKRISFENTPEGRRKLLDTKRELQGIYSNTYGQYKLTHWKKFYVMEKGL